MLQSSAMWRSTRRESSARIDFHPLAIHFATTSTCRCTKTMPSSQPARLLLHRTIPTFFRSYSTTPRPSPSPPPPPPQPPRVVPVDDLCIPISPPYSIASYIPEPTPLSRDQLTKLHRLSALVPPSTEQEWAALDDLGALVAIIEGVRLVDTSAVQALAGTSLVDGRVRGDPVELAPGAGATMHEEDGHGRQLLELAEVTDGSYYTVETPLNVRGKKRGTVVHEE